MPDEKSTDTLTAVLQPPGGKLIAFFFTMRLETGEELDSNREGEPMIFQTGTGEMWPVIEEKLMAMKTGERDTLIVAPEQAYGLVDDTKIQQFPVSSLPEEAREAGRMIMVRDAEGEELMAEILAISEDTATIDLNHALAGKTLKFELEVVASDTCRQ